MEDKNKKYQKLLWGIIIFSIVTWGLCIYLFAQMK
jgi:hypothetical protein